MTTKKSITTEITSILVTVLVLMLGLVALVLICENFPSAGETVEQAWLWALTDAASENAGVLTRFCGRVLGWVGQICLWIKNLYYTLV